MLCYFLFCRNFCAPQCACAVVLRSPGGWWGTVTWGPSHRGWRGTVFPGVGKDKGWVGFGWVGLAASCKSRPSGVGFLPCPTTRLNYLTVRFQGRADCRQPPDPTEAQVGGRYRRPVCRRARGRGRACAPLFVGWAEGLGLARGGQVWPGAPSLVGRPWEPSAEPTGE